MDRINRLQLKGAIEIHGLSKIEAAAAAKYAAAAIVRFRAGVRLRTKRQRLVVLYNSLCINCR